MYRDILLDKLKLFLLPVIAVLFGATAHALERVRKVGWRGWVDMITDIIICSFMGFTFYHLTSIIYPSLAILSCSIGSYWGTKGFVFLKNALITTLQANLDKIKGE